MRDDDDEYAFGGSISSTTSTTTSTSTRGGATNVLTATRVLKRRLEEMSGGDGVRREAILRDLRELRDEMEKDNWKYKG